jgi:hypothetical protein
MFNWKCNFWGIHDWQYKSIKVFGSNSWGTWSVSAECKRCGETAYYHIENRILADKIEKIIEEKSNAQ